jgi:mannosyltransferase OCH1-like enzyme
MRTYLSRFPSLLDAAGFLSIAGIRQVALKRFIRQQKRDEAHDSHSLAPGDIVRPLPRIIWIYWAQGESDAPEIVRFCIESWRTRNPGWTVHVLDRQSEHHHVDMADVSNDIRLIRRADILRLRLLHNHGGLWVDATTYCHRPLDDWLPLMMGAGFFMFSRPGPDRMIANWFIAAEPSNDAIGRLERYSTAYWATFKKDGPFYFAQHYMFEWLTWRNKASRLAWSLMPRLPATSALVVQQALSRPSLWPVARDVLARGWPISKLNHKRPFDRARLEALFAEAAPS